MSGPAAAGGAAVPWAAIASTDSDGVFVVEMDGAFAIADGVCNGGYVLGVLHEVARQALTAVGATTISAMAVSGQFLAPTPPGPAAVRILRMRTGRSVSRVDIEIGSGGRATVRAGLSFRAPAARTTDLWSSLSPPVLTEPARCRPMPRVRSNAAPWPTIYEDRVELLVDPATSGFLDGTPSGRGEIKAWWSARQPRVSDAGLLLVALDAMPPATFELGRDVGRSPTVQLEARLYCEPDEQVGQPFMVRQQVLTAGPVTADQACEVWDASGRLLASATQVNWIS